MSKSSVLASFDPLAVHPFTNTSGLLPKPAAPSQYPMPLPPPSTLAAPTAPATNGTPAVHAPQPKRASPATKSPSKGAPAKGPIFVPFRPERSSPDLEDILLKKKVSDALANKQPWGIDAAPVRRQ